MGQDPTGVVQDHYVEDFRVIRSLFDKLLDLFTASGPQHPHHHSSSGAGADEPDQVLTFLKESVRCEFFVPLQVIGGKDNDDQRQKADGRG